MEWTLYAVLLGIVFFTVIKICLVVLYYSFLDILERDCEEDSDIDEAEGSGAEDVTEDDALQASDFVSNEAYSLYRLGMKRRLTIQDMSSLRAYDILADEVSREK